VCQPNLHGLDKLKCCKNVLKLCKFINIQTSVIHVAVCGVAKLYPTD
jgi:hypothetical protein